MTNYIQVKKKKNLYKNKTKQHKLQKYNKKINLK